MSEAAKRKSKAAKLEPLARKLYVEGNLTQKEVAEYLGVTEITISRWANANHWQAERNRIKVTPTRLINKLYEQIDVIVDAHAQSNAPMDAKTANNIKLISSTIRELDKKVDPVVMIDVFTGFVNWLRGIDVRAAQVIVDYQRQYIQSVVNNE